MKRIVNHLTGLYCLFYTLIMCSDKGSFVKNIIFIGALFVLVMLYFGTSETAKLDIKGNRNIYVPVLVIIGYALLTFMWSRNSNESLVGIMPWINGWIVALLQFNVIENEDDLNVVVNDLHIYFLVLLFIGFNECNTGIYNFTHNPMYEYRLNGLNNNFPAAGYSNTNNFAYAVSILFPFAVYDNFMGRLRKLKLKYFLFIFEFLVYCWLIINTASRLVMLTFVLFIVFILFYNARNLQKNKLSMLFFAGILGVIFILVAILSSDNGHIVNFITQQFTGAKSPDSKSDMIRITLLGAGLKMFFTHPYGVGIGESTYLSDEYYTTLDTVNTPLHNMLLIIMCEIGIIGIVCFVYLLYKAFWGLWQSRLKSPLCNVQTGILIASIVCYLFMSMAPSNATLYPISYIVFGVWFSYFKIFKDYTPQLELFSKKDSNSSKYGYVKPYDRNAAIREHEENLRRIREQNNRYD